MGFSRVPEIKLSSADTLGAAWDMSTPDEDGHYRLSWHLGEDDDEDGWRAGQRVIERDHSNGRNSTNLADLWKKMIYYL